MTTHFSASGFHGHVLIIGGGIGGNALALFLKKSGIQSTVYEGYAYRQNIGGGLGLAPNGMKVLAALGLAEATKRRASLALENVFYSEHGRVLVRKPNGSVERYGQPGVSMLRSALHDVLLDEVKKQGIPIEFEKRLANITYDNGRVTAHFTDGTTATGDVLVGADGIHSQTRRLILPDAPSPEYIGLVSVGGITPGAAVPMLSERDKQSFHFTNGSRGFFGYMGIENGDMMWWSNLPRETELSRDELAQLSLETIQEETLAIFKGYHEPIETLIRNTHSPVRLNLNDILSLPTWHNGRVVLLGDAAHAVSPNAGQGASMALEDAMLLAKLLRGSADYEAVFTQFERERKPRVERIVAEGRRLGKDKTVVSPFQAAIRDVMTSVFINLFMEKSLDWLYRYDIQWDDAA